MNSAAIRRNFPFVLAVILLAATGLARAQNENETVGFQTNHVFESGHFGENIDVLNGGLNLTIPIGQSYQVNNVLSYQLELSYNSKVWDTTNYQDTHFAVDSQVVPYNEGPFGIGFSMHFGRIYVEERFIENCDLLTKYSSCWTYSWYWVAPDGSQHEFYHDDARIVDGIRTRPPMPTGFVTTDNTYVRIFGPSDNYCYPATKTQPDGTQVTQHGCYRVDTPDGLVRYLAKRVDCIVPDENQSVPPPATQQSDAHSYCGWYTTLIEDPSVGTQLPAENGTQIGVPRPIHVAITYDTRSGFEHLISRIDDSAGREIAFTNCELNVDLNPADGVNITDTCKATPSTSANRHATVTRSITMPAFGNNAALVDAALADPPPADQSTLKRAEYDFFYEYHKVKHVDSAADESPWEVAKLVRIDYPDVTVAGGPARQYSSYYSYYNNPTRCVNNQAVCQTSNDCSLNTTTSDPNDHFACAAVGSGDYGELTQRTLPMDRVAGNGTGTTGVTRYIYAYEPYYYIATYMSAGSAPKQKGGNGSGSHPAATGFTRAVTVKRLDSPTAQGTWVYDRGLPSTFTNPPSVVVTDPFGNDTQYFYHASEALTDIGEAPDDGFAPEWRDGMNYRIDYYEGPHSGGRLVKSDLQEYDSDPYDLDSTKHSKKNLRVNVQHAQNADDAMRESITTRTDWDGSVGRWRNEVESGTDVEAPRTTRTVYANNLAIYKPSAVLIEVSDGVHVLSRAENQYDVGTARITKSIGRLSLPAVAGSDPTYLEQPGDLVTTYTYSTASGNAIGKTISTGGSDPTYTIAYTYAPAAGSCTTDKECGGYLATKSFMNGGVSPWKAIDRVRDGNTGLVLTTRDPSGISTQYSYDKLGRIMQISPAAEEPTVVDYPSLLMTTVIRGNAGGSNYIYTRYLYDGLGRLVSTQKRPADPYRGYSCQKSQYDALGRVTYKTEWSYQPAESCTGTVDSSTEPGTAYFFADPVTGASDPFGRVRKEVPADSSPADDKSITTRYFGNSTEVTQNGVRAFDGTASSTFSTTTTYYRDVWNRLVAVDAPAGGADAIYSYDAIDHLQEVDLTDSLAKHQYRRFGYDGLGRQSWADNPENGVVSIESYDALGNVQKVRDAEGNEQRLVYDFAGRLTDKFVTPYGDVERQILHNTYDETTAGASLGKLTTISSWDGETAGSTPPILVETRAYNGVGGRLSTETYAFNGWTGAQTETTTYTYDTRGEIASIAYPQEPQTSRTATTVLYQYVNGVVTQASEQQTGEVLGSVTYNASGGVSDLMTPNGGHSEITFDSRNRPSQIKIGKPTGGFWNGALAYDSGAYAYDGAGNIYQIGDNRYGYDGSNRLNRAFTKYDDTTSFAEFFSYDIFGNMNQHFLTTMTGVNTDETDNFIYSDTAPNNRIVRRDTTVGSGVSGPGPDFDYDANGNLVFGGRAFNVGFEGSGTQDTYTYDYDSLNRLLRVYAATGITLSEIDRFTYDSQGNRISKLSVAQGLKTYYVRDASGQVLSEFRSPNVQSLINPEWAADYVYLAGRTIALKENLKPRQPINLRATQAASGSGFTFTVTWDEIPEADKAYYKVWRKRFPGDSAFVLIGQPTATSNVTASFQDPTVENAGLHVLYMVSAVDNIGYEGNQSAQLGVVAGDQTGPPTGSVTASAGDSQVLLTWAAVSDPSGVRGYEIFRGTSASASASDLTPLRSITPGLLKEIRFLDVGLQNDTTYYYRVRAVDNLGNVGAASCPGGSPPCDAWATPHDLTPPSVPREVRAAPTCSTSSASITLSWEANDPGEGVQHYRIYRSTTPTFDLASWVGTPSSSPWKDPSTLVAGTTYYYAVRAEDGASPTPNVSMLSSAVSASPRDSLINLGLTLTTQSGDGFVTVAWNKDAGGDAVDKYIIYRKLNALETCDSYVQVGEVTADESGIASFRDGAVANNAAYDYVVAGRIGARESFFSTRRLGIPLARPQGIRQCLYASDATMVEWNPPAAAVYQPITATSAEGTVGFLKGYHLYHHQICPQNIGTDDAGHTFDYVDSSRLSILKPSADSDDPYLLKDSSISVLPFDPRYVVGDSDVRSSTSGAPMGSVFSGCWNSLGYAPNCVAPRAVYKIYADGAWLTVESAWPDYFDPQAPDRSLRCSAEAVLDENPASCGTTQNPEYMPPPRKVTALPDGPGSILLSWEAPTAQVSGYQVYARNNSSSRNEAFARPLPFATVGPSQTSLKVSGLNREMAPGDFYDTYVFTVAAIGDSGQVSGLGLSTCSESGHVLTANEPCPNKVCTASNRRCVQDEGAQGDCAASTDCAPTDLCCKESISQTTGRWCTVSTSVDCQDSTQCPLYNQGHCSGSGTSCLTTDKPTANCVCIPGELCRGVTNEASAAPGSEAHVVGTPGKVRNVIWTVNDNVLPTRRARNGIKVAWTLGAGSNGAVSLQGYRVYRSQDDGSTWCALLKATSVGGSIAPPLPDGKQVCASELDGSSGDSNAYSESFSTAPGTLAYWDRTVMPGQVNLYRVTEVSTDNSETAWSDANETKGVELLYDKATLPPVQGFRAWAPQDRSNVDERGIALRWCPSPAAPSVAETGYPTIAEYRVYRRESAHPDWPFSLLARLDKSCMDPGKRCEMTHLNTCSNGDPATCSPIASVTCDDAGSTKCRVMDFAIPGWPETRDDIASSQANYNYTYYVTVMGSSGSPATVTESMPSTWNEGWLNYCSPSYDNTPQHNQLVNCINGYNGCWVPGCPAPLCIENPCTERRDPDGDGDDLVCGDESASLEPSVAGYRTIGLPPVCEGCDGDGGGGNNNPYNPPARYLFYHADHLGSPRVIMDASSNVIAVHHYLPFGEERPPQTDSTLNDRGFTGHQRDQENELDYMMARYYSSSLGRFMAVDPGDDTQLENPQSWNKYSYVRNSPVGMRDPDGRVAGVDDAAIAYAGYAAGAAVVGAVVAFWNAPSPSDPTQTNGQALASATVAAVQAIGDAVNNLLANNNSDTTGKDKPAPGSKSGDSGKAKDRRAAEQSADRAARRGADTWAEPASEKYNKDSEKKKEKDDGKKGRRQRHDEKRGPDRTKEEIDEPHKRP